MPNTFVCECRKCNCAHLLTTSDTLKVWLRELDTEEVSQVDYIWDENMMQENEVTEENRSIFNLGIEEWRIVWKQFKYWKKIQTEE